MEIWRGAVKEDFCKRGASALTFGERGMSTVDGRSTLIYQKEILPKCKNLLVFFRFLLHVADFLRDGLEGVFVVGILHLQLC